jgi:dUTP pyrophosphatase
MIDFKVKLLYEDSMAPVKAHEDDACYDVFAHSLWVWDDGAEELREFVGDRLTLKQNNRYLIKTGISISVPPGYEVQVRPRSGITLKKGITILNRPGTIDCSYTGEVGVIMLNTRDNWWRTTISKGDRIAQLAVRVVPDTRVVIVDDLDETERGTGGFGSSGK